MLNLKRICTCALPDANCSKSCALMMMMMMMIFDRNVKRLKITIKCRV